MRAVVYLLLVIVGLAAVGFSDVYFRAMGHTVDGISPDSWDHTGTLIVCAGLFGLLIDGIISLIQADKDD